MVEIEAETRVKIVIIGDNSVMVGRAAALAIIANHSPLPFSEVVEKLSDCSTEALEQAAGFLGSEPINPQEPEARFDRFREIEIPSFVTGDYKEVKLPPRKPYYWNHKKWRGKNNRR